MDSLGGAITEATEALPISGEALGPSWYVVQTKRYREQVAQKFVEQQGMPSYLPRIIQWPPPAVGGDIAPMFPGYLFVYSVLAHEYRQIASTPCVKSFVSFGEYPVSVDPAVIDFLRSREGPDGLIRCGTLVQEQCEVEIVNGPFRGLTAVVQQCLPAHERVRVLMHILQRETSVELPAKWVRRT